MKLQDIETLLALPYDVEMEIYNVPLETINEVARLYDCEIQSIPNCIYTTVTSGDVKLTLNTINYKTLK